MKAENVKVLVCDLHTRTTGVSTTIRSQLTGLSNKLDIAFVAFNDHPECSAITLRQALTICNAPLPKNTPFRIWHARRNNEMIWGLIFKYIFRCKIKLLFTSAAKRKHSWFPRKLIHSMDKIIATTAEAASYVPNVEAVIGHGVDENIFKPAINKKKLKVKMNIDSALSVGIVGRVRPEKGTDVFVNSMIEVFKCNKNIDAYIFGLIATKHQSFAQKLKNKIQSEGLQNRFHWMGVVDINRMPDYQACMDITVAPAKYEGYGMVPLEAMSCKNTVITTKTGAYELMIDPGQSGFIVDTQNELTQKMNELLNDPDQIKKMGEKGYERVLAQFTLGKEISEIIDVYQNWWINNEGAE